MSGGYLLEYNNIIITLNFKLKILFGQMSYQLPFSVLEDT